MSKPKIEEARVKPTELMKLFKIDDPTAKKVAQLMQKRGGGRQIEKVLDEINELIGGYGVEAITSPDVSLDDYPGGVDGRYWGANAGQGVVAMYVNFGDTYDTTVVFSPTENKFLLTSWGDMVQWAENKHGWTFESVEDGESDLTEATTVTFNFGSPGDAKEFLDDIKTDGKDATGFKKGSVKGKSAILTFSSPSGAGTAKNNYASAYTSFKGVTEVVEDEDDVTEAKSTVKVSVPIKKLLSDLIGSVYQRYDPETVIERLYQNSRHLTDYTIRGSNVELVFNLDRVWKDSMMSGVFPQDFTMDDAEEELRRDPANELIGASRAVIKDMTRNPGDYGYHPSESGDAPASSLDEADAMIERAMKGEPIFEAAMPKTIGKIFKNEEGATRDVYTVTLNPKFHRLAPMDTVHAVEFVLEHAGRIISYDLGPIRLRNLQNDTEIEWKDVPSDFQRAILHDKTIMSKWAQDTYGEAIGEETERDTKRKAWMDKIWSKMPGEYKGKHGGKPAVLVLTPKGGTTIMPLADMSDAQLRKLAGVKEHTEIEEWDARVTWRLGRVQEIEEQGARWSAQVKTKWTPPKGLFTRSAKEVATVLHNQSESLKQAMSRLNFYINRAGSNLSMGRKRALNNAKPMLRQMFGEVMQLDRIDLAIEEAREGSAYPAAAYLLDETMQWPLTMGPTISFKQVKGDQFADELQPTTDEVVRKALEGAGLKDPRTWMEQIKVDADKGLVHMMDFDASAGIDPMIISWDGMQFVTNFASGISETVMSTGFAAAPMPVGHGTIKMYPHMIAGMDIQSVMMGQDDEEDDDDEEVDVDWDELPEVTEASVAAFVDDLMSGKMKVDTSYGKKSREGIMSMLRGGGDPETVAGALWPTAADDHEKMVSTPWGKKRWAGLVDLVKRIRKMKGERVEEASKPASVMAVYRKGGEITVTGKTKNRHGAYNAVAIPTTIKKGTSQVPVVVGDESNTIPSNAKAMNWEDLTPEQQKIAVAALANPGTYQYEAVEEFRTSREPKRLTQRQKEKIASAARLYFGKTGVRRRGDVEDWIRDEASNRYGAWTINPSEVYDILSMIDMKALESVEEEAQGFDVGTLKKIAAGEVVHDGLDKKVAANVLTVYGNLSASDQKKYLALPLDQLVRVTGTAMKRLGEAELKSADPSYGYDAVKAFLKQQGISGSKGKGYDWAFEHGQLWIIGPNGGQWSVVDASGGPAVDGFDFETVTEPKESTRKLGLTLKEFKIANNCPTPQHGGGGHGGLMNRIQRGEKDIPASAAGGSLDKPKTGLLAGKAGV